MKSVSEITDQLKIIIEEVSLGVINRSALNSDDIILDLGLDSLDYTSIMLAGEEFVEGKVNENLNWKEVRTIEQLAQVLYESQK